MRKSFYTKRAFFWKAYEVSAYLFIYHIKPYDAILRYYKNIKRDVVYLGFPASYIDTIRGICVDKGYEIEENSDNMVTIQCNEDIANFMDWKQEMIAINNETDEVKEESTMKDDILQGIISYPLATKTPMEAQQFLYDIQMRIDGDV